jgi:hypothetical protein
MSPHPAKWKALIRVQSRRPVGTLVDRGTLQPVCEPLKATNSRTPTAAAVAAATKDEYPLRSFTRQSSGEKLPGLGLRTVPRP